MTRLFQKKIFIGFSAILLFAILFSVIFGGSGAIANATAPEDDCVYYGADEMYGASNDDITSEVEEINYVSKNETNYIINPSYPTYYNTNNTLTNCCANIAGSNIIGLYNRYYSELIPDCTAGLIRNNIFTYYPMPYQTEQKQAVIDALYVDMKTNNPNAGTNQANYKSGLTAYVNRKGRNISFTSVRTNGMFDLNKAVAQLKQGNPISLYMQGYNITKLQDDGSRAKIVKVIYNTNHIMIAYGYQRIEYLDANNSIISTKIYLHVATGYMGRTGVYVVNNNGTLDDAEAVRIY